MRNLFSALLSGPGPEERDLKCAMHSIIRELRSFNLKRKKNWARDMNVLKFKITVLKKKN